MYLKTYSPYLDSPFTHYSKSQNIIGVNLLGTLLHSSVVLITPLSYLHTQPIAGSHRVYAQGSVTKNEEGKVFGKDNTEDKPLFFTKQHQSKSSASDNSLSKNFTTPFSWQSSSLTSLSPYYMPLITPV